ncbi:MAG TPA: NADH-quinone oxidoreductase subunit C [Candidatus Ozemobacteraceae bacterium]|nr:NADH-quinone oxidoreductase subunit C [Candidatus Ozemobacteraceae bacterium]
MAVSLPELKDVTVDALTAEVSEKHGSGWRFVTMTCVDKGSDFDLMYHFDKEYKLVTLRLQIPHGQPVPSVSRIYFAALVIENEIKDMFGVPFSDILIDFGGRFFLTETAPKAPQCREGSGIDMRLKVPADTQPTGGN